MFEILPQVLTRIVDLSAQFFRNHRRLRGAIFVLSPVFVLLGTSVRYFSNLTDGEVIGPFRSAVGDVGLFLMFAGLYLFATALISLTQLRLTTTSVESELEPLRKEREELKKRLQAETPERRDVFDTIQLSLNQITEYYTINKGQARNSFRSSVFATVLGLATLISGIWFFYFHRGNIQLAALSGISGLLVQFIGGAYFYLYNKSLAQLNFFFENLVRMQDTMLAVELCEQLDEQTRDATREKIIMALINRGLSRIQATTSAKSKTSGGVLPKPTKAQSASN